MIIDGHNLIGSLPDIQLDDANDEDKLILKLKQYHARTGRRMTVVFDPGGSYKPAKKQTRGGITVQYAPYGKTADQVIIRRLRKTKNPQQLLVVTSDRAIQRVAHQARAAIMSSADFAAQLMAPLPSSVDDSEITLSEEEIDEWLSLFNQHDT